MPLICGMAQNAVARRAVACCREKLHECRTPVLSGACLSTSTRSWASAGCAVTFSVCARSVESNATSRTAAARCIAAGSDESPGVTGTRECAGPRRHQLPAQGVLLRALSQTVRHCGDAGNPRRHEEAQSKGAPLLHARSHSTSQVQSCSSL
jgi:hypothetical protein